MHPTSDLAEITLYADLKRLQTGAFDSLAAMNQLIASALSSVAILEELGGFSRGEAELAEIKRKLLELKAHG